MTVQEMIIGVQLGVQKVDSNAFGNIITEEAEYYLNKAVREYMRRQTAYLRESLEDVSRQDFLSNSDASYNLGSMLSLEVIGNTDLSVSPNYDNAIIAPLSSLSNKMFSYVHGQIRIEDGSPWKGCDLVSPSKINRYTRTDYNHPIFREYPIVVIGSNLYIFFDSREEGVHELSLLYAKEPKTMVADSPGSDEVTTSELPTHTHDDIVDLAVGIITEDIKSARPYEQNQRTLKGDGQ